MYYDPNLYQQGDWENRQRQLLKDIEKAINDEFQAVQYYTKLAELAPNNQLRKHILTIRQDEIQHFYWFSKAYYQLSGNYSKLTLGADLPRSFRNGVRDSIKEEQDTVPVYRKLASQISNPQIADRFLKAANDEQRHSEIFSQMSTNL